MRIALVYTECHRRGGVERVVWEAARFLAARHEVTVVCRAEASADIPEGVAKVGVRAGRRPGSLAPLAFRLASRRALQRLRPDVTVSFGFDCPAADVLVVQSVHASWVEKGRPVRYGPVEIPAAFRRLLPRHQVRLLLERYTMRYRKPRCLIAVSDNVADDLIRLYDAPRDMLEVLPNGFDPDQCSPARRAELRPKARAAAGLHDERTLVMVANEWHRKGLAVVIEAMRHLPEPYPMLLLVGRMAPTQYLDQIAAAGLDAHVKYMGAMDDVASAYAAADLFVLPTQYEAFGTVIVEALACGVPVVTTARAGASVTVHPDENGLLQDDPNDAVELEGLLRRALAGDTLSGWAAKARGSVDGYEWPSIMARMEALIVHSRGAAS